jgi:hypothetical protein
MAIMDMLLPVVVEAVLLTQEAVQLVVVDQVLLSFAIK